MGTSKPSGGGRRVGLRARMGSALASAFVAQACVLGGVDLGDKPCPCSPGFTCDVPRNRCLREGPVGRDDPATSCDDILATTRFCESFEDRSLTRWREREAYRGRAFSTPVEGGSYRGSRALIASADETAAYAELLTELPEPLESGVVHVRAYMLVPSGPPLVHANILHFGRHRATLEEEDAGSPEDWLIGFNFIDEYAASFVGSARTTLRPRLVQIPRDRWFCVQMELAMHPTEGSVRVWIDGELAVDGTELNTRPGRPYTRLGLGVAWTSTDQPAFEVFVDELALGDSTVACDPPAADGGTVGLPDGGRDAGAEDAGPPDAGSSDAGPSDASVPDGGAADGGRDAGVADAGRDAGVTDAGSNDASSDAN